MATTIIGQGATAPSPLTITGLPDGARALLVSIDDETGYFSIRPVAVGESVLNIERDLFKHLNERPHTTEWLEVLRDYCVGRLMARAEAGTRGAFITPKPLMNWDMTSIIAAREASNG